MKRKGKEGTRKEKEKEMDKRSGLTNEKGNQEQEKRNNNKIRKKD